MDADLEALNALLTDTYDMIVQVEEKDLTYAGRGQLSISEFHTLACIAEGKEHSRSVGEIAEHLHVTLPTVTVAVKRLEKKGYVTKEKAPHDARIALVRLTEEGRRMDRLHRFFHEQMAFSVRKEFTDEEMEILMRCLGRINRFMAERI